MTMHTKCWTTLVNYLKNYNIYHRTYFKISPIRWIALLLIQLRYLKMDYAKIYDDFYLKYYNKTETLIKLYFIKCKNNKRPIDYVMYNVRNRLENKVLINLNLNKYDCLQNLHNIFLKRYALYEIDILQEVFTNEIKEDFDKIKKSELPINYSYSQLIKDIVVFEIINEILRLLQNNSKLLNMCYRANYFDEFEIREHKEFYLENYPLYKKLDLMLTPPALEDKKTEMLSVENIEFQQKTIFKVALKFATGEAQDLYNHNKHLRGHFKIICLQLGFKETDRPYFSEMINENTSPKNLFLNAHLMQYVFKYCEIQKIKICQDFLIKIKQLDAN